MLLNPISDNACQKSFGTREILKEKPKHKFQERFEVTYEQYVRDTCLEKINLAKELVRSLGRKKAFEIIERASEDFGAELTRKRATAKPINSLRDFAMMEKESFKSPFSRCTQTITVVEDSPKQFSFHVTECLWAKTFRDLDAGDIGYAMECRTDFTNARARDPRLRLKRTKTLMQGDSHCDFAYYWAEQDP